VSVEERSQRRRKKKDGKKRKMGGFWRTKSPDSQLTDYDDDEK
jgi:hypothetical protein